MLSPSQLEDYQTQGFVILKDFATATECQTLRARAATLVAESGPQVDPRCGFDTTSKTKKIVSHSYFVESTNDAKLFFEACTVTSDGRLLKDANQSIVKIGHALHDFDPVFEAFTHGPRMHAIAHDLGYSRPLIGQSRYFFRLPHIKQIIPPHQDSNMLFTEPLSCYALWLALDDASITSGCMWVSPGSHHLGLESRYVRDMLTGQGSLKKLRNIEIDNSSYIPLEVPAGAAVIMSGELFHKSDQNKSTSSRQAYAVHFIEGASSHQYPEDNWLQRPGGFRALRHLD